MAPIFTSPLYQPLSDSGQIQPGCYLQFFESETDTPTDVYADADLNTSRGGEVESDAAGRFPVIYMDVRVLLRVKLFDADDQLIYDIDPVFPVAGRFVGEIVLYDGDLGDLPVGWQVCDGTNGTLDSRNRFPVGAGGTYSVGSTGGATTVSGTTSDAGGHDHGGATADHTLTIDEMPQHTHIAGSRGSNASGNGSSDPDFIGPYPGNGGDPGQPTGGDEPHAHDITAEVDHNHTFSNVSIVPPYMGLYLVKFVGA